MGRNARRRAEKRDTQRGHGVAGEAPDESAPRERCPRCGATNLVFDRMSTGVALARDVMCASCGWQGMV